MAVKNTNLGGTDHVSGAVLEAVDLNDTTDASLPVFYNDNTGGSVTNSTTETDLCTITVTQNDLNDGATLVVSGNIRGQHVAVGGITDTFRLYVDGSVVKTITFDSGVVDGGGSFHHVAIGLDSTAANIIVKITGQMSAAVANHSVKSDNMVVVGYNR